MKFWGGGGKERLIYHIQNGYRKIGNLPTDCQICHTAASFCKYTVIIKEVYGIVKNVKNVKKKNLKKASSEDEAP